MKISPRIPTALAGLLLVLGLAAPAIAAAQAGRITNISTRGQVLTGNDVMIGGFIIEGASSKTVVVRARGPSLVPYGIANALANPTLRLVRSSDQTTVATNDDWGLAANSAAIAASGFAPSEPREAAILVNLVPGAYTAIVSGEGGGTGVGIVEVFALDAPSVLLSNISTRGQVLTGNDVMIGGFVVEGSAQAVVVRARGPSLTTVGITNALGNPTLQLVRSSDQSPVATNADWGGTRGAAAIAALGLAPANALESAILATLDSGAYTAIVSGAGGGTGVGIVEVFAVDSNRAKSARLIGGTWTFSSSLGVNGYTLTAVGSAPDADGSYPVSGTTESGQPVSGGFSPPDAKWDLLQQGSSTSFYYTFDFADDDHISGCHYLIEGGSMGPCAPLTGSRASTTPPPPPPPGPVIPPGCTTGAHHYGTFTSNGQKIVFGLAPGETAAAALPLPVAGSLFEVGTTETVNTPPDADHQVAVSKCPGDFTPAAPCMYQAFATGSNMFTIGGSNPFPLSAKCELEPGVQYFMNVRQVVRSNTSLNSCTNPAGCEIRVQIQGM